MDYQLKFIYEQMLAGNTKTSGVSKFESLTEAYKNIILNERALSTNLQMKIKMQAADRRISVTSSSKEIRIQPVEPFTSEDLFKLFQDLNLTLVKVAKPGEQDARSGQLPTYVVQDEKQNQYFVVLGKGKGFSVQDENKEIENLNQQIREAITTGNGQYIVLNINGITQKINGVKSTPGVPKSDFEFTYDNKSVMWISHKAGTTALDFQQYGGTTCASGQVVCNHPEVLSFVQAIRSNWPEMPPKTSVYRKIEDPMLKKYATFGADFGKDFGINNVNALYQGNLKLVQASSEEYTIKAAHATYNGELPEGNYEPILYGRFSASRGGNHGIKNLRTGILPLAKISSSTKLI